MNNLTQEISLYTPNFEAYGNTYIIWGTDWVANSLIVTSARFSDRIIDFSVEQGAGFTAMFGMLMDGQDMELEMVDVSNVAEFSIAQNPFTIVSPSGSVNVLLAANSHNYARKREGMRTASFKSFTLISLGSGTTI